MRLASTCQCGAGREYLTATDSCYKCGSRWPKAGAARQPQGQSTRRAILAGAAGAAAATGAAAGPPPPETDAPMPSETDAPKPPKGPIVRCPMDWYRALNAGAGIEIRYNTRLKRIETRKADAPWQALNDRRARRIQHSITPRAASAPMPNGASKPLILSNNKFDGWLADIAGRHEIDPFLDWIEALPPWDGIKRLDGQLTSLFGAKGKLARWAARYPCVGAIQRARNPGCKLDELPVLIGPQGCGKSAWCAGLLPPEQDRWFSSTLALNAGPKVQVEATDGRVIVEISELKGVHRADLDTLKAYLTRQDDGAIRRAYARYPEPTPRRFVFVATANMKAAGVLPNDPTGNRRFVPVTLQHGSHVEAFLEPNRDQLWAEALAAYKAGRRANLPRDLMPRAAAAARDSTYRDLSLEDQIEEIETTESGRAREGIKLIDLAGDCGLVLSRPDGPSSLPRRRQDRLLKVLQGRGWQSCRISPQGQNAYRAWCFKG